MRTVLIAAALGLALLPTRAAPAAPFSAAFDNLKAELEFRRDDSFGGTLDATQKRQQKAVLKSLVLIGKTSDGFMTDLKTYISVAKLLEKAYAAEIGEGPGGVLFEDIALALSIAGQEFGEDYQDLSVKVGAMAPSTASRKAAKFLAAATAAKDKPIATGYFFHVGKNRLKSWKFALKGLAAAEGAALLPAPSMDFTADGVALSTQEVYWQYHSVSHSLSLTVYAVDGATGDTHALTLSGGVEPGTSTVNFSGGLYHRTTDLDDEFIDIYDGTITVTTLDIAGHVYEGSFAVTATGLMEFPITGTFSATWNLETIED